MMTTLLMLSLALQYMGLRLIAVELMELRRNNQKHLTSTVEELQ